MGGSGAAKGESVHRMASTFGAWRRMTPLLQEHGLDLRRDGGKEGMGALFVIAGQSSTGEARCAAAPVPS